MLFAQHQTSPQGLTQTEAQKRLEFYGSNELKAKKRTSYLLQFLGEFKDIMVIILILAVILAFLAGETVDALIILIIVILNATIGFLQEFKAEKAIEALKKLMAPYAKVIRDGKVKKIPAKELVPGDILILEEGDHITADAVLFEENELQTQEAALSGESVSVQKNACPIKETQENEEICHPPSPDNMVFMGTIVTHGNGKAIVIKTGMDSEMGKIAALTTETKKDLSPLEKELKNIGVFVGKLTFVISLVLFLYGILVQGRSFLDTLLFAVSVAVAAVPEGLPATITIALAIGVQRLAKNNAIVKQLSSVETLGATTVICSDKTGTLTKNEMTVKELYFDCYRANISGAGYAPEGTVQIEQAGEMPFTVGKNEENSLKFSDLKEKRSGLAKGLEMFFLTIGFCNNASLTQEQERWNMVGDPTEGALLTLMYKSGFEFDDVQKNYERVHEFPFDSVRKRMTVLVREKNSGKIFAFTKGAPISILQISDHILVNANAIRMDEKSQKEFTLKNEQMAENALRVLGFSFKELTLHEQKLWEKEGKNALMKEEIEKNMVFLGLTGMIDPPRPEVKKAIELTKKAGIRVYIITGDHGLTAKAVAQNLGLLEKNEHLILSGEELDQLSTSELKSLLSKPELQIIFARVSPEHKLRVVSALKELGEIVAVTGDGVNDAPALKRADIGVAMGSGTDVSKEAANMVLTDDSFSTIVKAIQEGRTIYENLKKFIFFIFSSNIGELVTIFAAILLFLPAPLTAIFILIINLFTDVLPALALGVEPHDVDIMDKKPRRPQERMLKKEFLIRIFSSGVFIGVIVVATFIFELSYLGWNWGEPLKTDSFAYAKSSTMAFVLLVMIQMAHAFNAKSEYQSILKSKPFQNGKLLLAVLISIIITIVVVEVPFFQKYLKTVHLELWEWLTITAASFSIIFIEEVRKFFVRKFPSPSVYARRIERKAQI
jgi:Ca2+-transporting ATPase